MFGFDERVIRDAGADVGIKAQRLADGNVQALEPTALWRGDRRFEKNFCPAQGIPRARFDARRVPGQVNFLADVYCFYIEVGAGFTENMQSSRHDFRPDSLS